MRYDISFKERNDTWGTLLTGITNRDTAVRMLRLIGKQEFDAYCEDAYCGTLHYDDLQALVVHEHGDIHNIYHAINIH